MPTITAIDPVTRIEGHLKITVTVDNVGGVQQVVDAQATGTLFRGFEQILLGRVPQDAEHITQRICGVCPVAHGMAAVAAMENVNGTKVPKNARILRNLVNGANFLQSHILHFYHLAAPDFINGPDMPPWTPTWNVDRRINAATTATLVDHYVKAVDMTRQAHEMGAIFGGRMPAPPTYIAGGFTAVPTAARITQFRSYLNTITDFIKNVYLPDVQALAGAYSDYFGIGRGPGNLLSFGVFELDPNATRRLLNRGRVFNGGTQVGPVDTLQIQEYVTHSWYDGSVDGLNPAAGVTNPQYPKDNAYSWLKAPRYKAHPYEVGALARMWVNRNYRRGISVMDRHAARAQEALLIATAMGNWLNNLTVGGAVYTPYATPTSGTGVGLTEAPRGALGHWLEIGNGRISRYQIVTPTCWNASPLDDKGRHGPIEAALVGTPVQDVAQPVEVLRVIHSFDPCLSCAVHVMRPAEEARIFKLGHYHSADECHLDDPDHGHDHGHDHSHAEAGHSHHEH